MCHLLLLLSVTTRWHSCVAEPVQETQEDMSRELPIPSVQREKESLHPLGLAAICFGFFMMILDTSVVNVALPAMPRDLHGTLSGLQWVVNGSTLVFASLLLSAGTLGDRLGHKRALLTGYMLFTGASFLYSLALLLTVLMTTRVLHLHLDTNLKKFP